MKRKWLIVAVLLLLGCVGFTAVGIYRFAPDDEGVGDRGPLADAAIVLGAAVCIIGGWSALVAGD